MTNEYNTDEENIEELNNTGDSNNEATDESEGGDELAKAKAEAGKFKRLFEKSQRKKEHNDEVAPAAPSGELSQNDLLAVARSGISSEDLDVVRKFAQGTGSTIAGAMDDPMLKSILKDKEEERKTESLSNTGRQRGGNSQKNIDVIKSKASKGDISEDDMERLLEDRYTVK